LVASKDGNAGKGAKESGLTEGKLVLVVLADDWTGSVPNERGLAEVAVAFEMLGCGRFRIWGWKGFSGDGLRGS